MGNRASAAGDPSQTPVLFNAPKIANSSSAEGGHAAANGAGLTSTGIGEVAREMGPNEEEEGYWGRVQRMAAMMDVRKIFITHRQVEQVRMLQG